MFPSVDHRGGQSGPAGSADARDMRCSSGHWCFFLAMRKTCALLVKGPEGIAAGRGRRLVTLEILGCVQHALNKMKLSRPRQSLQLPISHLSYTPTNTSHGSGWHGMKKWGPWKTMVLYQQVVFHFHG